MPSPLAPRRARGRLLALALGPLAAALLLAGCGDEPAPAAAEPAPPIVQGSLLRFPAQHPQLALLGITAAAPARAVGVELPARLVWNEDRTQRIYPPFAGRVSAISADVGDPVRTGSVLARVASPDFGQAQADAARARVDAGLTQRTLERTRELFDAGIVARKDLEQADADAARARAESQRALARTRLYGGAAAVDQQLALTAGITGVVVERNINPAQELRADSAGPGTPALFVVSDPTSLWVQIDARESEAGSLRPGSSFTLSVAALPGETFEGRIVSASDAIDPATRTVRVRGIVPNPARRLKAEMLATVHVERMLGAGVMVPAQAVVLRGTGHTVFVQVQPGVFEPREVRLGYTGAREVLITRGLEAGEQVVSENTLLLARQFGTAQDDVPAPPAVAASAPATVALGATRP